MNVASTPGRYTMQLTGARTLSPSVRVLSFRPLAGPGFQWLPGQYVEFLDPGPEGLRAPYSIASLYDETEPGHFEVAMAEGTTAAFLGRLEPGATLDVFGPRGNFTRRAATEPTLFVGAGTGIAPLRAMLLDDLRSRSARSDAPLVLLFGARAECDILWAQELTDLAERSQHFRFEPTLSKPDPSWQGRRGYVQAHLAELAQPRDRVHVYVCGPQRMVTHCVDTLTHEVGLDSARIFTERH